MLQPSGRFLRPSTDNRTLAILETLAEDSDLSQSALGERTGLSSAMINTYVRDLQKRGFINALPVNAKSYRYELTEAGERERREMLGDYCAEIVRSYTAIKTLVSNKLLPLADAGHKRLVLWGASETCEIVLSALSDTSFTILALLDSDPSKHGDLLAGHPILPPTILPSLDCDAVIITSFGRGDDIHAQLKPLAQSNGLEVVRL